MCSKNFTHCFITKLQYFSRKVFFQVYIQVPMQGFLKPILRIKLSEGEDSYLIFAIFLVADMKISQHQKNLHLFLYRCSLNGQFIKSHQWLANNILVSLFYYKSCKLFQQVLPIKLKGTRFFGFLCWKLENKQPQ